VCGLTVDKLHISQDGNEFIVVIGPLTETDVWSTGTGNTNNESQL